MRLCVIILLQLICTNTKTSDCQNIEISNIVKLFVARFAQFHVKFLYYNSIDPIFSEFTTLHIVVSLDSSSLHTNHHLYRKHLIGFIHVYFLDDQDPNGKQGIIRKMFLAEYIEENPDAFVIVDTGNSTGGNSSFNHSRSALAVELPTTFAKQYIFYIYNYTEMFYICLNCVEPYIPTSNYQLINDIHWISSENVLRQFQSNLNGIAINSEIPVRLVASLHWLQCEGFAEGNRFQSDVPLTELCVLSILSNHFNFTIASVDTYLEKRPHGLVNYAQFISFANLQYIQRNMVERQIWISHAVKFEHFYFSIIIREPEVLYFLFVEPFDHFTWISLSASVFAFTMVTLISLGNGKHIGSILFYLLNTVIDQPLSKQIELLYKNGQFLWPTWLISMLIVGQFYKGTMFSYLTRLGNPVFPVTVEDLILNDYAFVTFDAAQIDWKMYSVLKQQVLTLFQNDLVHLQPVFKILNSKIWFEDFGWQHFIFKMADNQSALSIPEKTSNLPNSPKIPLSPCNLAVIDMLPVAQMVSRILTILYPKCVSSHPKLFPGYTLITPWSIQKNYFYPIFVRMLARFYESGIYGKLQMQEQHLGYTTSLNDLFFELRFAIGKDPWDEQLTSAIAKTNRIVNRIETAENPIPLNAIQTILIMIGIFFGVSFLSFAIEILFACVRGPQRMVLF